MRVSIGTMQQDADILTAVAKTGLRSFRGETEAYARQLEQRGLLHSVLSSKDAFSFYLSDAGISTLEYTVDDVVILDVVRKLADAEDRIRMNYEDNAISYNIAVNLRDATLQRIYTFKIRKLSSES